MPNRLTRLIGVGGVLLLCVVANGCATAAPSAVASRADAPRHETAPARAAGRSDAPVPRRLSGPVVDIAGDERMGNRDAVIGILEFSDFQCPFCRSFHLQHLPRLKQIYIDTGVAQYIYKDFPLKMHHEAIPAAIAAGCAAAQEKYWAMHDRLFLNQPRLGSGLYIELARQLDLDVDKFSACTKDPAERRKVYRDFVQGRRANVSSTPTLMLGRIDGNDFTVLRVAIGLPDFEVFAREIERLRQNQTGD